MKVGSLFSGIGGLELGLERAGMETIWQSEMDSYASKVLAKNFPGVPNLGDITQIDWSQVERPDLVCGGFPCQPASAAGKRLGVADARWLWPEFARCIRELRPQWVLAENVPGLLSIDSGRGFGGILRDLAQLGFDAEWGRIPAAAVGAPHLRWRVFLVAHSNRGDVEPRPWNPGVCAADNDFGTHDHIGRSSQDVPYAPVRLTASGEWLSEPDVGRVAYGISNRVDRLRCLGNAVVPQVAEVIGRWIVETEKRSA